MHGVSYLLPDGQLVSIYNYDTLYVMAGMLFAVGGRIPIEYRSQQTFIRNEQPSIVFFIISTLHTYVAENVSLSAH